MAMCNHEPSSSFTFVSVSSRCWVKSHWYKFCFLSVHRSAEIWIMPGKLKAKIVAGRHLPVMDRASDLTDAFVEVSDFTWWGKYLWVPVGSSVQQQSAKNHTDSHTYRCIYIYSVSESFLWQRWRFRRQNVVMLIPDHLFFIYHTFMSKGTQVLLLHTFYFGAHLRSVVGASLLQ